MKSIKKGFTLIEIMVAMVILTVALLGLLAGLITVRDVHMRNILRDEAVKVAQEHILNMRNIGYNNINDITDNGSNVCNPSNPYYTHQINNAKWGFGLVQEVDTSETNLKKLDITVCWAYKNKNYQYKVTTIVRAKE